jgi:hypothetical protein
MVESSRTWLNQATLPAAYFTQVDQTFRFEAITGFGP